MIEIPSKYDDNLYRFDLIQKLEILTPMTAGVISAIGNWPREDDPKFTEIDNF